MLLEKILPDAKMANIMLCIENLPYDVCNDLETHKKFISLYEDDNVKACFDSGHAMIHEKELSLHLHNMRDWIHVVHMHDNDGKTDKHDRIQVDEKNGKL